MCSVLTAGIMKALVQLQGPGIGGGQLAELTSRKKACLFFLPKNSIWLVPFHKGKCLKYGCFQPELLRTSVLLGQYHAAKGDRKQSQADKKQRSAQWPQPLTEAIHFTPSAVLWPFVSLLKWTRSHLNFSLCNIYISLKCSLILAY